MTVSGESSKKIMIKSVPETGGMNMYDWNGNGKYDFWDSMMDYKLVNSHASSSSGVNLDWWKWFLLAIAVGVCPPIGVVITIIALLVGESFI